MAGRKEKHTVDYFPHYVKHGKTMSILEQKYGNDGYAFWFKLLELLGESEHHIYNIKKTEDRIYFFSRCNTGEEAGIEMLDLLVKLNAIDPKMYKSGYVYSDNYCANIKDAYRKRSSDMLKKAEVMKLYRITTGRKAKDSAGNTQSKVEESKVEESKKIYGEYKHVFLTDRQYGNLLKKWGEPKLLYMIRVLDEGIQVNSKKYKYTDHNLAIQNWEKSDTGWKGQPENLESEYAGSFDSYKLMNREQYGFDWESAGSHEKKWIEEAEKHGMTLLEYGKWRRENGPYSEGRPLPEGEPNE